MTTRSRMSSIIDIIGPEHQELFALEVGKIPELDFVYTLPSTNIRTSSITVIIGPEHPELFVLELEKMPNLTFFTL